MDEKRAWFERDFYPKMTRYLTPEQNSFIRKFVNYFTRSQTEIKPALGHYDLSHDHIIIDNLGNISGIIDFGDLTIGDPANEFYWMQDCAKDLTQKIYQKYTGPKEKTFLQRCKDHHIDKWIFLLYDGKIRRKNKSLWKDALRQLNKIMASQTG